MGSFDFKIDMDASVLRDESGKVSDIKVGNKSILKFIEDSQIKEVQEHLDSEDSAMETNPMEVELFDLDVEVEFDFSKGMKSNDYLQPNDPDEVEIESVSLGDVDIKDYLSDYYMSKIDDKAVDMGNAEEEEWEPDMDENKKIKESRGDLQFHATPYDISAPGFYFHTAEEFDKLFKENLPVEEYDIQFIDGSKEDEELWSVVNGKIDQSTLDKYFDEIVPLDDQQKAALYHLLGLGEDLEKSLQKVNDQDYSLSTGSIEDYAYDLVRELYPEVMKGPLGGYVDIDAFARDLEIGGEVDAFTFADEKYVISGIQ